MNTSYSDSPKCDHITVDTYRLFVINHRYCWIRWQIFFLYIRSLYLLFWSEFWSDSWRIQCSSAVSVTKKFKNAMQFFLDLTEKADEQRIFQDSDENSRQKSSWSQVLSWYFSKLVKKSSQHYFQSLLMQLICLAVRVEQHAYILDGCEEGQHV